MGFEPNAECTSSNRCEYELDSHLIRRLIRVVQKIGLDKSR